MTINDTDKVLERIIVGRVRPRIYAFTTNTLPNYLKVGDTYRPVSVRLREWQKVFPNLTKQFEGDATVSDDIYFRDFAVHRFLENSLDKTRLVPEELPPKVYFSNEFFKDTDADDVRAAIDSIHHEFSENSGIYEFYDATSQLPQPFQYHRGEPWIPRPNQRQTIDNFCAAVDRGRTNLLMFAVMRFGKSFTSLCCAKAISAKFVVVVSAKADVKHEWKKTVEMAGNFEGWHFVDSTALSRDNTILQKIRDAEDKAVVFLTLQDLQGKTLKDKHQFVFDEKIDVLIIDETHFGARAKEYGRVLRDNKQPTDPKLRNDPDRDDEVDPDAVAEEVKKLDAKIKLHLSGTPYRILMGDEFAPEDIVSFVQFSDIVAAQHEWDSIHLNDDHTNEWDNPYFGFPQMVRFAFNPNESSQLRMKELGDQGYSFAMSKLFEPESTKIDRNNGSHRKFIFESEILDLLKVIDGSQQDENVLGFLNYERLKEGKMCRHMVIVLPYRASCDALEALINNHSQEFLNLNSYELINISGVEGARRYRSPEDVKKAVSDAESAGRKTITLTVNRMLTGSTVEQWDTMLFLKDTSSPQEYDQAIFRLQNQYTRSLVSSDGDVIKENLKPQTLLVDFSPDRMFRMQEQKSLIYNANVDASGNDELEARIRKEVQISPIITINAGKIREVTATDIIRAVSEYNNRRSVADEARDIPVDLGVLKNQDILKVIREQPEIGSRNGLQFKPSTGEEEDLEIDDEDEGDSNGDGDGGTKPKGQRNFPEYSDNSERSLEKKLQTYYQRLLFYAMLTKDRVSSLGQIIVSINNAENQRIAQNLGLDQAILKALRELYDPFKLSALDYKIHNISALTHDSTLDPTERASRALEKFNRITDSEIRTSPEVCNYIVDLLPEDELKYRVYNGEKILDIASKSGELGLALYRRLTEEFEIDHALAREAIYSIPTSSIAYEFTRRFYEILDLDVNNIARNFTSYDLLTVKTGEGEVDFQGLVSLLTQGKPFKDIKLNDQPGKGAGQVKFGAVVGNPPYQEGRQDTSARQIYPFFMDASYAIAPLACLITPARFLFGAGKNTNKWNEKILKDGHIRVAHHWERAAEVFPEVEVKGGAVITLRDINKQYGQLGPFSVYPEVKGLIEKAGAGDSNSLRELVHLQLKFDLAALYEDFPEYQSIIGSKGRERRLTTNIFDKLPGLFHQEAQHPTDVEVLGLSSLKRSKRFIARKYISGSTQLPKWKVVLPKTIGSGTFGEKLTDPEIMGPYSGHTQSFISLGAFDSKDEAVAMASYLRTRFARALLGTRKATQDNNSAVWESVPLQDFSKDSPIDWTLSIDEIDRQLFDLYALSDEERAFINNRVQAMRG